MQLTLNDVEEDGAEEKKVYKTITGCACEGDKVFVALGSVVRKGFGNVNTWREFYVRGGWFDALPEDVEEVVKAPVGDSPQTASSQPLSIMQRLTVLHQTLRGTPPQGGSTEIEIIELLEKSMGVTKEGNLRKRVERLEEELC